MAAQLARTPAGTVGQVFTEDAARQRAYDFLESGRVGVGAIRSAMTGAAAVACAADRRVLVGRRWFELDAGGPRRLEGFRRDRGLRARRSGKQVISALAMTERVSARPSAPAMVDAASAATPISRPVVRQVPRTFGEDSSDSTSPSPCSASTRMCEPCIHFR